jgi:type IV pilus assembly protein PilX
MKRQSGLVLVMALIFLVLFSIIGVAAIRSSTLEEKMAGANKDRTIAFEAAEAAIDDAVTCFSKFSYRPYDNSEPGLTGRLAEGGTAKYWQTTTSRNWGDGSSSNLTGAALLGTCLGASTKSGLNTTELAPRYHVEYMAVEPDQTGSQLLGIKKLDYNIFRITAKGQGAAVDSSGNPVANVTLQRIYQDIAN